MSQKKKKVRRNFRDIVFLRDGYCCRMCGRKSLEDIEEFLDAHHITDRNEMPNGGYVAKNGISLCKGTDGTSCHEKAERWLKGLDKPEGFSPEDLYKKIGSSYEAAYDAALNGE